MISNIFELSQNAAAAFSRHGDDCTTAPATARKFAREQALEHLTDIFLAYELEQQRQVENRRIDTEYKQRLEQERVAKIRRAFAECDVDKFAGKVAFFTDVIGGAIVDCDVNGHTGNKAAETTSSAALSMLKNSNSENQYHIQLPAGVVCVRVYDSDAWRKLSATWNVPSTVSWRFRDCEFHLFSGSIGRNVDCNEFAFTTNARCGRGAEFIVAPADVVLDASGNLPALPQSVADAISQAAVGSESLLKSYLLK